MTAYYNEIDPYAAAWLRNLIAGGHIAPGDVDERSILDVRPDDLRGYTQCHFFAGIGVWSYAARRAGWPDERPLWTGSCPCQPFSAAGKGGGFDDERHLWPGWHHLIRERRPAVVFGEQVASKDGYAWLDLVQADMEGLDYALGPHVSPSAGFGAPHERHRIRFAAEGPVDHAADARHHAAWQHERGSSLLASRSFEPSGFGWMGDAHHQGSQGRGGMLERDDQLPARQGSVVGELADGTHGRRDSGTGLRDSEPAGQWRPIVAYGSGASGLADADSWQCGRVADGEGRQPDGQATGRQQGHGELERGGAVSGAGPTNGFWRDADWLFCRDGKWRPVEPGTFPLAHGAASRVGRLRAYGNAVDAEATEHFIRAYLEKDIVEIDAERLRLTGVYDDARDARAFA